jgi:hypothetical protein
MIAELDKPLRMHLSFCVNILDFFTPIRTKPGTTKSVLITA